jgi:UDP-N-acetylmuramoyl-L-alanyl-D-glutamate--2,6-diaminopimelate ligase
MRVAVHIEPNHLIEHLQKLVAPAAKIRSDSRQIKLGDIFFAYPVGHGKALRDGRLFIAAALESGAKAVVYDPINLNDQFEDHPQCFAVENLAKHAGFLSAQWYGNPSRDLNVIGVTGTNGKTSITQWIAQALDTPSQRAAVIGTLGTGLSGSLIHTGYTTPDAPTLQTQISELRDQGAKQLAIEVSSHALEQGRIAGLDISCAVFSNLTQDHLDYHANMTEYAQAKAKLFNQSALKDVVLNMDDPFGRELAMQALAKNVVKVWGYALEQSAFQGFEKFGDRLHQLYAKDLVLAGNGYDASFIYEGKESEKLHIPVIGEFNVSNCLAVWGVLLSQGLTISEASKRVSHLKPVIGRMELIHSNKTGPLVIVDYAHTPDALEKVLKTLRPIADERQGRLWCVFGCGGDRDVGKRPQMGRVAEQFSDEVIITSDNPRSEDPNEIIAMINSGMTTQTKQAQIIVDRAAAIMAAVRHATEADIVLVAGKGHESTQEINGKKFDFSDQEHILLAAGGAI